MEYVEEKDLEEWYEQSSIAQTYNNAIMKHIIFCIN